jgi:hypothetical protein
MHRRGHSAIQANFVNSILRPLISTPLTTGRRVVRALSVRARGPVSDFEPCIWNPSPRLSDISGDPSGPFSGASDRSGPIASEGATACIAISSKMKGMHAIGRALRGLARMLLGYAKEAKAQEQTMRGDVQMPASIQLIT